MSDSDVSMDDSSPQLRAAKSIAQTMLSKDAAIPGLDQVSVNNDLKLMTSTRTFAFRNEDHTLGNLVRYFLMKNPHVEAAGYNIPHPSENIMNLWVQTKAIGPAAIGSVEEVSPDMALEESFENVQDVCKELSRVYADALARFKAKQGARKRSELEKAGEEEEGGRMED